MNASILKLAQRLALQFALWFGVAAAVEWATLLLGLFGSRPVITAAFYTCVNLLAGLACLPLVGFSLFIQAKAGSRLPRGSVLVPLATGLLYAAAVASAFWLWTVFLK